MTAEIPSLLPSFRRHLRAENRADRTIQSYTEATDFLARFLKDEGLSTEVGLIEKRHVEAWMEGLIDAWKPSTAANRFRSLQQFFKSAQAGSDRSPRSEPKEVVGSESVARRAERRTRIGSFAWGLIRN